MLRKFLFGLALAGLVCVSGCTLFEVDRDARQNSTGGEVSTLAVSAGNTPGTTWMAGVMDKYHSAYDVYSDFNAGGNHFVVKALMGENLITMKEDETNNVYSGDTAIKVVLNPAGSKTGSFYSSTKPDGTPNSTVIVANSECLPLIALKLTDAKFTNGLSLVETAHQVGTGTYGFDYNTDKDGYWYEGMAGMAMAYLYKGLSSKASSVISRMGGGQASSGGMYAASKDELTTGYEWSPGQPYYIYKREHTGTTAWKLLVDKRKNPYWIGTTSATLPGTAVSGATANYKWLTNMHDQFNRTYNVYSDYDAGGNHFVCYAGMGTVPTLTMNYTGVKYSGDTGIRITSGSAWGGYYFMQGVLSGSMTSPSANWGTVANAGVNLTGATTLTFYARGATGGEQVEFFCGGVGWNGTTKAQPYPDSFSKVSTGTVTLTNFWRKYSITVSSKDLSYVLGGFGFVIKQANKTIYIDQIQYNKSRLTEPRFIASYKTTLASGKSFDSVNRQACFTYDNSVALLGFLASGDNTRAKNIADALVYVSTNDRYFTDNRLRNAYASGDIALGAGWTPNGKKGVARIPCWYNGSSTLEDSYAVGTSANTMAWGMLALLGYYQTAGGTVYLDTAKKLGDWVENNLRAPSGYGYYSGYNGWEGSQTLDQAKVVEHNSALYSAFSRLYSLTSDSKWNTRATWAKNFVTSMWNVGAGYYFMNGIMTTGSTSPITNWGKTANAGVDLTGATELTFYAKGAAGNEKVEFFCGGIGRNPDTGAATESYPDSMTKTSTGVISLTTSWKKYTISLSGKTPNYVLGGFGYWVSTPWSSAVTFYIDNIQFNKPRLSEPRLLTSYQMVRGSTNDFDKALKNVAYVYDNALAIMSFLAAGENDRARLVADALIYAQEHDRYYTDGRMRNAYKSGDIATPAGWVINGKTGITPVPGFWYSASNTYYEDRFNVSSDTGNQAWVMLAWLSCYNILGDAKYLNAAKRLGNWVDGQLKDTRGFGGYMGQFEGWEPATKRTYKSTEHNLDLYVAFKRLYDITGESKWLTGALTASNFCINMWDDTKKTFYSGVSDDGVSISYGIWENVLPLDTTPWMLLALQLKGTKYTNGLLFNEQNAQYPGTWGFDYDNYDSSFPTKPSWREGIWYEGTGMMGVAYLYTGNDTKASNVLNTMKADRSSGGAQYAAGPNGKDYIFTGFYLAEGPWNYYRREHIAPTAWAVMLEKKINPFWYGTSKGYLSTATPAPTATPTPVVTATPTPVPTATCSVTFTSVPAIGSSDYVKGKVSGVSPANYKIALYIYVNGWGWVSKPYANAPYTTINSDGTWQSAYVTGGSDSSATIIAAFLSPIGYNPPVVNPASSLPAELYSNCPAYVQVNR